MAQQQAQLLDTIRAMKVALKRHASDALGDDDEALHQHTNRGNKLQRNARHLQHHRLDTTGRLAFKKTVEHAGYTRTTISTNPPLFDDDGDLYSPTSSDHDGGRHGEPLEDDPFAGIQLHRLLRPLTSPAELPDHPGLNVPYKSSALTNMADEALEMLRRERASLWKAKRLLQRFRGDYDWVPCSTFETDNDELLLSTEASVGLHINNPSVNTDQQALDLEHLSGRVEDGASTVKSSDDITETLHDRIAGEEAMNGVVAIDMATNPPQDNDAMDEDGIGGGEASNAQQLAEQTNGILQSSDAADPNLTLAPKEEDAIPEQASNPVLNISERETASETASNSNGTNTHAMTTRARARSPAERSDRTPSPSPSDSASIPVVSSWFMAPTSCLTDRDLGLPSTEAEDTRKLLLLYVQKQEQVVRSLDKLYTGLQKADRLRHYVFRSCKAESHLVPDGKGNLTTEMSDGEDWYDIADWTLTARELKDGQLEKGKDEIEDVEEEGRRRPGRGRRVNRM